MRAILMPNLTAAPWAIAPLFLTLGSMALPAPAQAPDPVRSIHPVERSIITADTVASNATCPGMTTGDRRVASGSVSTRWVYWVLQNSARQYYVTYWAQHDCTQWRQTATYPTQREAYSAFMCQYIRERCNPE